MVRGRHSGVLTYYLMSKCIICNRNSYVLTSLGFTLYEDEANQGNMVLHHWSRISIPLRKEHDVI